MEANGPHEIQAHFVDMREVAENLTISSDSNKPWIKTVTLKGFCALHGREHAMNTVVGTVDCIISGLSCKPFSCARSKRFSQGSNAHKDADLYQAFLQILRALKPKIALVENVYGLLLPESKQVKQTPLETFLAEVAASCEGYHPVVFLMHGSTFMILTRRRVYILLIHESAGGARACQSLP